MPNVIRGHIFTEVTAAVYALCPRLRPPRLSQSTLTDAGRNSLIKPQQETSPPYIVCAGALAHSALSLDPSLTHTHKNTHTHIHISGKPGGLGQTATQRQTQTVDGVTAARRHKTMRDKGKLRQWMIPIAVEGTG